MTRPEAGKIARHALTLQIAHLKDALARALGAIKRPHFGRKH
jgi:hypothetical protein